MSKRPFERRGDQARDSYRDESGRVVRHEIPVAAIDPGAEGPPRTFDLEQLIKALELGGDAAAFREMTSRLGDPRVADALLLAYRRAPLERSSNLARALAVA